jgi:hypothetical protein
VGMGLALGSGRSDWKKVEKEVVRTRSMLKKYISGIHTNKEVRVDLPGVQEAMARGMTRERMSAKAQRVCLR